MLALSDFYNSSSFVLLHSQPAVPLGVLSAGHWNSTKLPCCNLDSFEYSHHVRDNMVPTLYRQTNLGVPEVKHIVTIARLMD